MTDALHLYAPDAQGPCPTTVGDILNLYLESKRLDCQAGAISARHIERLEHYLGVFRGRYGGNSISQCQQADIVRWLLEHPEWEAASTRANAVGSVVACFRWADGERLIERCPYRRPRFLGPSVQRPAITRDEYRAMQRHARRAKTRRGRRARTRDVFRAGHMFLWRTGCRTCEMREVLWSELDRERWVIIKIDHKSVKTSGAPRYIPVRRVRRLLLWLWAHRKPGQKHIFANSLGKPWQCDRFAKEFRRYAILAGIRPEVSAYCCRHGLTVRLLERGVSTRSIADVLGHASTRYVDWYGKATRTKAEYLNDALDGGY